MKKHNQNSHEKRDVYRFWNHRVKSRWRCVARHHFMALARQQVPPIFSNHHLWLELFSRRLHDKLAHGWIDTVDQRHRLMILKDGGRKEGKGNDVTLRSYANDNDFFCFICLPVCAFFVKQSATCWVSDRTGSIVRTDDSRRNRIWTWNLCDGRW